jgi:hypothetical protein
MPQALYILFGAAFTVAVCLALGLILLRALSLEFYRQEELLFAFLAGAPCLSLIVFLLAALGLARKGVFLAVGLVAIGLSLRRAGSLWVGLLFRESFPRLPRFWRVVFGTVFTVFALLCFFHAMAPEMSPDGSTYHLGLVARYLREHGFHRITTNMYANLSQGVEMLFLFAFAFGRHSAAALVHFAFLITLPLAMLSYARRFGLPVAGAAGALLVFVSPVVGIDGASAYIDVAVAAVLFGLFYLLQIWDQYRKPALLVLIGLLAGFGYAAKYTAFLAVPYALGFVAWKLLRARRPLLRPLLVIALCAAAMMIPWLAKNALWLNNPFSPFLNSLFPNPYVHISFEQEYVQLMRNYGELPSRWRIPVELTVRGGALCGLLGPLFLLAPMALLALRYPAGRRLLVAAVLFGLPYYANIGTRFLIPALPFLSLAMGLAVAPWKHAAAVLVLAHAVLSWPDVMRTYSKDYAWRLDKILIRQAFRIEPEESYLTRKMPTYPMTRLIEDKVPPDGKVFMFSPLPEAYTSRDLLVGYQSAFSNTVSDILLTPVIREYQPTWQYRFRFPAQPLKKIRVLQTAAGGPDQWSVTELRVFLNEEELPRSPFWRLRAQPNPFDVQMAFDNSPVTRWRSWQSLFPGMFVEVDFGRAEKLDTVVLEASADQHKIRLKLEGQDASGNWGTLLEAPQQAELPPPSGLRRAAVAEVRARGIGYLVVSDSDFGADNFRKNVLVWGLRLVGERNRTRLYELAP